MNRQTDMDDWPESLRRNALVCDLARAIFESRGLYYTVAFDLTAEPPHVRERYVTLAHELLTRIAPLLESAGEESRDALFSFAANLTRAHFSTGLKRSDKVIGVITPDGD